MTDNPNLAAALALAAHGVAVFPCMATKRPQTGVRWKEEATTDERRIASWWRRWPDSLPAFEPGRHGLIVIDCDRHGGPDGVAAFANLGPRPDDAAEVETPSGGRHVFFRNPNQLGNGRGALPPGVDVRGKGGYVCAEGSILPDGRSYRPAPGSIGFVESWACQAIPDLPDWLEAILTARPEEAVTATKEINPKPLQRQESAAVTLAMEIGAREGAAFAKALEVEARNVATAGEGGRNHALNTAAFNLGQMVASGWGARATVEHDLTAAAMAAGLRQPEIRKTIASGLAGGMANPRPPLTDRAPAVVDQSPIAAINGMTVDAATGEVLDDGEGEPDDDATAPPIDEALTHVGGVLGEIVEFIVATSRRPNRRLALAAALPLCGTLMGRRMATPTGAALHLYVIATYPTGGGKQHQLDAIDRLFRAAGLQRHLGPSQFMSMSALVRHVQAKPLSICGQDEFGAMLARLGNPRASSHEQGISQVLRSLWGASFSAVQTPAYATAPSQELLAPAISLFGPTTAPELYEALKGRDIANGFLNRFLVLDGGSRVPERQPARDLRDVPQSLVERMLALYAAGRDNTGGNIGLVCKNVDNDPHPVRAAWGEGARDVYLDLASDVTARMDADAEAEPFLARTVEIALRCATIRAVGDDPRNPTVSADHMAWGAALAVQSADRLMGDAARYMTDALGAAEFERKLIGKLRAAPGRSMTQRKLHMDLRRHFRFANDLDRALDALAKSGIVRVEGVTQRGGTRKIVSLI